MGNETKQTPSQVELGLSEANTLALAEDRHARDTVASFASILGRAGLMNSSIRLEGRPDMAVHRVVGYDTDGDLFPRPYVINRRGVAFLIDERGVASRVDTRKDPAWYLRETPHIVLGALMALESASSK